MIGDTPGHQVTDSAEMMTIPRNFRNIMCLEDLEAPARAFLPRALWEFASTGAEANISREGNRKAFDEIWFRPRILKNVTDRAITQPLFDQTYDSPFGIAPMGASAMSGFEADLNFARAARQARIPYIMSGSALIPMEKILNANPDVWFQAYVDADRDSIAVLADRAWAAGVRNFVVTVDVPVPGNRGVSLRAGFEYPIRPGLGIAMDGLTHPRWLLGTFFRTLMASGLPHIENYGAGRGIPIISRSAKQRAHVRDALEWDDLKWLRDRWKGKLIIKGVLAAEDARQAAETGLDGVMVSNHGGRQLDTAISPLRVLSEIAAEKGNMAILYDGGIRRGTDVVKALALGADFAFIGRPFLYAAALGREAGVAHAIKLLNQEIDRTVALLGCTGLNDLESRILQP